jgi:tetratricopeptide (TPR) repeat protein/DNA-binding XRE family transcriptional regulator
MGVGRDPSEVRLFGELVRTYRHRLGLTQDELAAKAGVGVRSVRDLEAGRVRPRSATMHRLAAALDLSESERDHFISTAAGVATAGVGAGPTAVTPAAAVVRPAGRGSAGRTAPWPRPAQLPHGVVGFAGRREYLDALDALAERGGSTVVISAIAGTAGVGKTALAVHWAHRVADRFPDGQLYVNLRGFDPSGPVVTPAEAVGRFLDALGVGPGRIPADLVARAGLYRSLLAGRRMLVVLDNARDAEQVRPLLPGAPGCLAVVTSRNDLSGLVAADGAAPFTLDVLPPVDARRLLELRLGADAVAAEPEATEDIIVRSGRLPLALAIVAARATAPPTVTLGELAAELRAAGLAAFAVPDAATDVRTVFGWSYRALPDEVARLFRMLGRHPGPDFSVAAAASLAGVPEPAARASLAALTRAHLLTAPTPGRFAFHDLLRAYAAELVHDVDDPSRRREALGRLLDHYVHTGHTAARLFQPQRERLDLPEPRAGVVRLALVDGTDALAWFAAERDGLLAAVERAAAEGFDAHAWWLGWALVDFLDTAGRWRDLVTTATVALAAAARLGDGRMEALAHRFLGRAHTRLGRHEDAERHLSASLDLFAGLDDPAGHATTRHSLALLVGLRGRAADAVGHGRLALEMFRAAGHVSGQARAHNTIGWYLCELGRYDEAATHCERALALHQETGNAHGEGATWDSLGYVRHRAGDVAEAIRCYGRALDLIGDSDRVLAATVLDHLAEAHLADGDATRARSAWARALAILEELDEPSAAAVRDRLAGLDGPAS